MKIFFYALRTFDELDICKKYSEELGIEFDYIPSYPDASNLYLAEGYDAISCTPCDMSRPVIKQLASLGIKYIACRSIGYDHVDLKACAEYGIRVSNVFYPSESVADYAIMLMLMCYRRMNVIMERANIQDFSLPGKIGKDINGATIGVIGTGKIGKTVIRHLSGFDSRIIAYDPYPDLNSGIQYVTLEELFKESDIITIHANATEENYHLLDKKAFALMKDNVCIINTSRGKLIDADAMIDAIKSGKVGSAGLDVLENENGLYYYNLMGKVIDNDEYSKLKSYPNVLLLPHTAFYTDINVDYMVKGCFEAVHAFGNNLETIYEVKK